MRRERRAAAPRTHGSGRPAISSGQPGTYAAIFKCRCHSTACVGSWGELDLRPGYYVYVGSAFGPGGVRARVLRHWRRKKSEHWHIDYLREFLEPIQAWFSYDATRLEHRWARFMARLPGVGPIDGFGCSDCRCQSHLFVTTTPPQISHFRKLAGVPVASWSVRRRWLDANLESQRAKRMGASSWYYVVPYDEDVRRALRSLRERVFAEGRFRQAPPVIADAVPVVPEEYLGSVIDTLAGSNDPAALRCCRVVRAMLDGTDGALTDPEDREVRDCFLGELKRLQRPPRRRTNGDPIAQLIDACGEQGTHSILDITSISRRRKLGAAAPLAESSLLRIFGSREPSYDQVLELWAEVAEGLRPWQAVFFTVYDCTKPVEIVFVGCSGD